MLASLNAPATKLQAQRPERQPMSAGLFPRRQPLKVLSAQGLPKRMMHSPTVFPGEDAPGTGLRHFPEDVSEGAQEEDSRPAASHLKHDREGNFQYKTTKQCYEEFPAMVHSGFLLNPPAVEHDGSEHVEGPQSGNRRRPAVVDEQDKKRPRFPGEKQSADGYLREVLARRGW